MIELTPWAIGWICIAVVFVLLIIGIPVAIALAVVGFLGFWAINGLEPALGIIALVPYSSVSVYALSVIPFFILMGNVAYHGGFGADIFRMAQNWLARIPGGLAHATVVGCAVFGAICGSGLAGAATMGRIAIPELFKHGYDRALSIGTVAASGTLAQMIPPSVLMVVYALITNQSVGKMLIAGIVPGILTATSYSLMIALRIKRNPELGPAIASVSMADRMQSTRDIWPILILIVIVVGGIYTGLFTPTEAAGVAASVILLLGFVLRRMNYRKLIDSVTETMRVNAMLFLIMAAANIFGVVLATSRIPNTLSDVITQLDLPPFLVLCGIMGMYLVLGTFFDMLAAMFITLPIIFPLVIKLGYDPIWFGVLIVHLCQVALITPPYGLNLFILKSVAPNATMREVIRGATWFILMDVIVLIIYMVFPQVILFLPHSMD
ncbi:MAG: TRAP transporter large permease [Pseudorhodoplanes sp.]|nr:C4-dicarboxylate TRAP transporter large permease protein DctM [Pseudorhodoplanes sp.]MBW7949565.1 TRAP transporter large permease [Pseudorhodoplanes sp.]